VSLPDAPEAVLAPLAVPFAEPLVVGVVPVPFAPFVVFSPVNRWSGLVAVLLLSLAPAGTVPLDAPAVADDVVPAPPDDAVPAPRVVDDE